MPVLTLDQIGLAIGFVLTLMVFSYVLGDNALYRLAVYAFAGITAGFTAVLVWDSVLAPWVRVTVQSGNPALAFYGLVPFLLAVALLLKSVPRSGLAGRFGNLAVAFLVGVGGAVALVGAISGTLIPLTLEVGGSAAAGWLAGGITVVGTVGTLFYFQHGARRRPDGVVRRDWLTRLLAGVGGAFIAVTLGALYAAALAASLTVLAERVGFLVDSGTQLFGLFF